VTRLQKWQGSGTQVSLAPILPKDFRNSFCSKQGKVQKKEKTIQKKRVAYPAAYCMSMSCAKYVFANS
jgi:hypothetical protein